MMGTEGERICTTYDVTFPLWVTRKDKKARYSARNLATSKSRQSFRSPPNVLILVYRLDLGIRPIFIRVSLLGMIGGGQLCCLRQLILGWGRGLDYALVVPLEQGCLGRWLLQPGLQAGGSG